jgi:hypothetical protein
LARIWPKNRLKQGFSPVWELENELKMSLREFKMSLREFKMSLREMLRWSERPSESWKMGSKWCSQTSVGKWGQNSGKAIGNPKTFREINRAL